MYISHCEVIKPHISVELCVSMCRYIKKTTTVHVIQTVVLLRYLRSYDNHTRGGRQGSREPKTAQCGAVLLNANVWDLRLFSVRFFAAGPKVDPRVKCIMS